MVILIRGDKVFSLFMRGQQLLLYFKRGIKNSDMQIQIRLALIMMNTLQVVHKTLDNVGILPGGYSYMWNDGMSGPKFYITTQFYSFLKKEEQ